MSEGGGELRYTSSGAEFRVVSVAEITAGYDEWTWWRTCPRCNTSLQGGEPALAAHLRQVCKDP